MGDALWQGHSAYALARMYGNDSFAEALAARGLKTPLDPVETVLASCADGETPAGAPLRSLAMSDEASRILTRVILHEDGLDHAKRLVAAGIDSNQPDEMGMKIVSFKICPFVQRVTALLEAKGVDYDIEYISLKDKPQWFLDISPNGQVPVLITDGGQALFESDAIVEYLEDAYPRLQPDISLETRATNRAWSYLASKNYLVQCSAQRSPDRHTLQERSAKLGKAFDRMKLARRARRDPGLHSL